MDKQDKFLEKVSLRTNISKEDILSLAQLLQTKDLQNEQDIRDFVLQISKMTGKSVDEKKIEKIIQIVKTNQVPQSFDKMI